VREPVLVSVDMKNKIVEVNCKFYDSAMALGCVVYIAEGPNTISRHFIARNGSSSVHKRINLSPECIAISSSNITVYTWKEDGSVGNTAIPVLVEMVKLGQTSSLPGNQGPIIGLADKERKRMTIITL